MSLRAVQNFASHLPFSIEDQIVGYARSVQDALSEIFQNAQVPYNETIANQVVFIAGIKKLYAICNSNHRVIDDSLNILARQNTYSIRFGRSLISQNSNEFIQLENLLNELVNFLGNENILELVSNPFYSEIVITLNESINGTRS